MKETGSSPGAKVLEMAVTTFCSESSIDGVMLEAWNECLQMFRNYNHNCNAFLSKELECPLSVTYQFLQFDIERHGIATKLLGEILVIIWGPNVSLCA